MTLRARALQSVMLLTAGQVVGLIFRFVRNIIVARLLTQADYGISATFALTVTTLETLSTLSMDRIIVQSRNGDTAPFMATTHFLQICRGGMMAVVLLLSAWPLSALFSIPEARWAFYWLAVIPLMRGFMHADMNRLERHMMFLPKLAIEVLPQALIAAAAWPVTAWLADYSAPLWLLIAETVLVVFGSHMMASRAYRVTLTPAHAREILKLAWPLLFNGILMFSVLQGDRYIVGAAYTIEDFAAYALAASLVLTAIGFPSKIANSLALPMLADVNDAREPFERRYRTILAVLTVTAVLFAVMFVCAARPLVPFLFGEKYAPASMLVAVLAVAQAIRLLRVGPSVAALARGDARCALVGNAFRTSGVALALALALLGRPLTYVAIAALAGEIPALVASAVWVARTHGLPSAPSILGAIAVVGASALCGTLAYSLPDMSAAATLSLVGVAATAILAGSVLLMPHLRELVLAEGRTLLERLRKTPSDVTIG